MRYAEVLVDFAWHEKRSLDLGRLALPDQVVAEDDPAKGDPHLLGFIWLNLIKDKQVKALSLILDLLQVQEPQILTWKDDQ